MIGRCRFLKCLQVAADALGGEALTVKLPHGSSFVTRIAVHRSMCADQWKTILMRVDGLDQNLPASYPMAEVALRSIFPPVKVGMTILTIASHIGENGVDMAFFAGNAQVQAA